ncbi:hypothetical protein [Aeromonas salmonicida]
MTHITCNINALQLSFGTCTVPLTFNLPTMDCTLIGDFQIGTPTFLTTA